MPAHLSRAGLGSVDPLESVAPRNSTARKFAGGCPAARYFRLLRQKKVAKGKATEHGDRTRRPNTATQHAAPTIKLSGYSVLFETAGGCGTRGSNSFASAFSVVLAAQTVLADIPRCFSVARRRGMGMLSRCDDRRKSGCFHVEGREANVVCLGRHHEEKSEQQTLAPASLSSHFWARDRTNACSRCVRV